MDAYQTWNDFCFGFAGSTAAVYFFAWLVGLVAIKMTEVNP